MKCRGTTLKKQEEGKYDEIVEALKQLKARVDSDESSSGSGDSDSESESASDEQQSIQIVTTADVHTTPDNASKNADYYFLGLKPKSTNMASDPLHDELAIRWTSYLQQGIDKDKKNELLEKYPLHANCPLLKSTILVPEDGTGHALAALGSQLNKLLENPSEESKELLTVLADVSQLVYNVHHSISTHRKYTIMPFLKQSARKVIEKSKTDELLFGKDFVSDLKAIDAAKKTSYELKPTRSYKGFMSSRSMAHKQYDNTNTSQNKYLNWKRPNQKFRKKYTEKKDKTDKKYYHSRR
ncbi:unnamed protein product [Ceutorhynchus assimilis]|uniref:Uncharacterized protein n=1 Tax=Ceutorhynchus assimilis TaxID=467358 RepID=A0A9N9QMV8_9CUCU|nr:unnamed protein product [Ceutorhynchus assimilis]CAG9765831.1 unnamed protein product [Ceutorhynchus assimilis]